MGILWYSFANKMLFLIILSEMAGWNSRISNFMKMQFFLLSIPLNHSITVLEFFHWLTSRCLINGWLIFSNLTLFNLQSSLFEGLIRRQGKLAWKFSLWSFRVMKARLFARHSTLSTRSIVFSYVFGFQVDWLFRSIFIYFPTFSFAVNFP